MTPLLALLLAGQAAALIVLSRRLSRGRHALPPAEPLAEGLDDTTVSVVVPTRNEAGRVGPCLEGLHAQGAPLVEVIVVDSRSTDATPAMVDAMAARDPRFRRITDPPLPSGCVGRPWAIAAGCAQARGEWILVVDADVAPRAGMVAGVVAAARRHALDAVSFAPRIVAPSAGARWLQPAFLATLVYRFGPPTVDATAERAVANGQCLLARRAVLEAAGGYGIVRESYCDDVRIVRHLAAANARVGFVDGPALLDVEMYPTAAATWRGWPRSLNMRDATPLAWRWLDALFLVAAQALPLPMLVLLATGAVAGPRPIVLGLALVNAALLGWRLLLLAASAHSFARRGIAYWLAPLADLAAVARVVETTASRSREWRGAARPELAAR